MSEKITIAEAIRELRSQLETAMTEGAGQRIRFKPANLELELSIAFSREGEAGGKVTAWTIFEASGRAKVGDQSTHRVKLVLQPVEALPKETEVVQVPGNMRAGPLAARPDHTKTEVVGHRPVPDVTPELRLGELVLADPKIHEIVLGQEGAGLVIDPFVANQALFQGLQSVMQNPEDPRYQAVTSIARDGLLGLGGAPTDKGGWEPQG
ncbi:hypothetical protein E2C06_18680 [Dankookia rubra]|uniref:Trypsin-co-occurring domain-containing protein n=1 Tax=Dankookia rubra TaxID=1442381 RepID=A0A4R5QEM8_9PROT|nr:trypco2 family protein [Dankookia rubra]TDH61129.1 hypothetical protein E2C06_18680 [Dankookia rubra]